MFCTGILTDFAFNFKTKCSTLQGVINVESLLKVTTKNNTQSLPTCISTNNYQTATEIILNGRKGDFVSVYNKDHDSLILKTFVKHMNIRRIKQYAFDIPEMDLHSYGNLGKCPEIWNHDAGRFWFSKQSQSIPVLHVTDTGQHRLSPNIISSSSLMPESLTLLQQTTEAVIATLRELVMPSPPTPTSAMLMKNGHPQNYGDLYNLMTKFMSDFRIWQDRIEQRIIRIEQMKQEEINTNYNQITLLNNNSTIEESPYYVLIGDKPTNIKSLNNVIDDYYNNYNNRSSQSHQNVSSSEKTNNRQNSPMIIKLVN